MSDNTSGTERLPSRDRRRFPGISSRAYEHPADRSALVALRKLSGFDTVFKALSGLLTERSLRLLFLANSVRVNDEQFAHLNAMLRDACYILDLEKVPPMYVNQDPQPNAMCIGLDEPVIVVTTGLVELLDEEEMRAVVGHEVGPRTVRALRLPHDPALPDQPRPQGRLDPAGQRRDHGRGDGAA